jgi:hypothetical protein
MIASRLNELFALKLAGVRHAHRPPRVRSRSTCSAPAKVSRRGWSARWRISPPRAPSASPGPRPCRSRHQPQRCRLDDRRRLRASADLRSRRFGLCAARQGRSLLAERNTAPGGKLPLNTNGGGVSALPPLHVDLGVPTQIIDPFKERLEHLRCRVPA